MRDGFNKTGDDLDILDFAENLTELLSHNETRRALKKILVEKLSYTSEKQIDSTYEKIEIFKILLDAIKDMAAISSGNPQLIMNRLSRRARKFIEEAEKNKKLLNLSKLANIPHLLFRPDDDPPPSTPTKKPVPKSTNFVTHTPIYSPSFSKVA